MSADPGEGFYVNPVGPACPDPFVLRHAGSFWAYGTGRGHGDRAFGVFRSEDLVHWSYRGGALELLPEPWPEYWAPEVVYEDGELYLYYSVGNETHMEIRVATARDPEGPFRDAGRRLTSEEFAIDAHVFVDEDGGRHLFYATDFLEHSHIGTGTVVDRLLDPFTLEGRPKAVARPRHAWQVYDPNRAEKGGVCWHTVEGPSVIKRKGRYFEMFSGGNWRHPGYGVGYAVTETLDREDEWEQACDGTMRPPILKSIPERAIGPGHNSIALGPDLRQHWCVYHRWPPGLSDRLLCIDRLEWVGPRLIVLGPTFTPEPAPILPTARGFGTNGGWQSPSGAWEISGDVARSTRDQGEAVLRTKLGLPWTTFEIHLTAEEEGSGGGSMAVQLLQGSHVIFELTHLPFEAAAVLACPDVAPDPVLRHRHGWKPDSLHALRVDLQGRRVTVALDGRVLARDFAMSAAPEALGLVTRGLRGRFAGFRMVDGWEDLFEREQDDVAAASWEPMDSEGAWRIEQGALRQLDPRCQETRVVKGLALEAGEIVINIALLEAGTSAGTWLVFPAFTPEHPGPRLGILRSPDGPRLEISGGGTRVELPLPADENLAEEQQLRIRRLSGRLELWWNALHLGEVETPSSPARLALGSHQAAVMFETVRVTSLAPEPAGRIRAGRR